MLSLKPTVTHGITVVVCKAHFKCLGLVICHHKLLSCLVYITLFLIKSELL